MADYYPLLARAISALPDSTRDSRQVIYERARKALLGQLRRVEPPVPEEDIQRESDALDAAVAKLEAEIAAGKAPSAAPPKPAAPPPASSDVPAAPAPPKTTTAPPPPPPAPRPSFQSQIAKPPAPPPVAEPPAAAAPPAAPRPTAPAAPKLEPQPAAASRPGLTPSIARERIWPPPSRATTEAPVAAPAVSPPAATAASPSTAAAPPVVARAPDAPVATSRPTLPIIEPDAKTAKPPAKAEPEVLAVPAPPTSPAIAEPEKAGGGPLSKLRLFGRPKAKTNSFEEVMGEVEAPTPPPPPPPAPPAQDAFASEPLRPIAPQAPIQRTSNVRYWVFAAILLLVVGGIATLAFRLRDNPEDFARVTRPNPGAESTESSSGKIVERIGAGPTTSQQRPAATQQAPQRPQTAQPAAPQQPAQATAPQTPIIPVAHRAALLIEAPDDPQKVKTFVGTVLWRIDRTAGAPPVIAADLDIPEAKFKASFRISKNTDPRLPASHTIDVRFTIGPDGAIPDVKEIDTLQMRAEDRPQGEALSGIPAAITTNYFLVGLSSSDSAQTRNLDLMRNRGWFDLPMLLVSGKIAKITFEKGATGDRMFNEVMAAWKAS